MSDGFNDLRELAQKQANKKKLKNKVNAPGTTTSDKLDYIIALLEE